MAPIPNESGNESEKSCRFCLESEHSQGSPLIAPCLCKGSARYVHRECLNEWRVHCLNPKAFVQCTTCSAAFRIQHNGEGRDRRSWKLRLAVDICSFLGLRLLAFLASACVVGFIPLQRGDRMLHSNPLLNHVLGGSVYTFAMIAGSTLLYGMWHAPLEGLRLVLKPLFKEDCLKTILAVLAIVGFCMALWIIFQGLYRLVCEARHGIVGAVRGANVQARRKLVQEHVVLDFDEGESLL